MSAPSSSVYRFVPLIILWFGAAVSVAEMQAGGMTITAGVVPGIWAIVGGHLLGALLMGCMGLLGYREKKPSIMCTRISFGIRGSWLLSLANALQLLGWTSVMLRFSGEAVSKIVFALWGIENFNVYAVLLIAALVALWSVWESLGQHKGNIIAVCLLGCLALLMTFFFVEKIGAGLPAQPAPSMKFGTAFDLALVMPLSWAPLVADYASRAESSRTAFWAPTIGYSISSIWMYSLGFAGALVTGISDPIPMMEGVGFGVAAGFGIAAMAVVSLSTLCSSFLSVYSTVISAQNIHERLPVKKAVLAATAISVVIALRLDSALYEEFLLLICAVFAPLMSIIICDAFVFHEDKSASLVDVPGMVSLFAGFAAHRVFTALEVPTGPSIACMIFTFALHCCIRRAMAKRRTGGTGVS